MKRFAIAGAICMALLFAAMIPALAQDNQQDNHNNDARQQEQHDKGQAQPDKQGQDKRMQDKQDENKPYQQDANRPQQNQHEQAAHNEQENGRRIDQAHYSEHFGRNHHFAVHHVELVGGRDRFSYGGYQFELMQPWPAGWSYDDNCYIEDVGGQYYLYDLNHPGIGIVVIVL
jgi:opacity protein-like surface antigen